MLNPRAYSNSRPDGFSVLELPDAGGSHFAPLKRTNLSGEIVGPLATLTLTQLFAIPGSPSDPPLEALYRFPLPGDAAVTGVCVRFGEVEVQTTLKEREAAEADYDEAKQAGRQAALLTRESPDVFTLAVAGLTPGADVAVETRYVQLARVDSTGWSLRVPLTTSPRYVRGDERQSRHAAGQPLALLRDPGHRFALALNIRGAERIASPTHALAQEGSSVRLKDGEVVPDRDCVLTWQPAAAANRPALQVWRQPDAAHGHDYFLALVAAPRLDPARPPVEREVVLLVDHSGSMEGAKWEAADWAVEKFLAGLGDRDSFALGLFHNTTRWFSKTPLAATKDNVRKAVEFLKRYRDSGGTELGVALEQALGLPRSAAPSRHVLVITDAEVTDAGRLLRLVDQDASRAERRRVSVLCIDAAPNAGLATELAARGGGVSRFLTSDPAEDDITTALDDVLADWAAPVFAGLTLEVNRSGAEAAGRDVALIAGGTPTSGIDLGDLPAGRPVWVVGRVPARGAPLAFALSANGLALPADVHVESQPVRGLNALFGADHLRRLEYVMHAGFANEDLGRELQRLGHDTRATGGKVYAENASADTADIVKPILVRESLAAGLPCSETALVAVRTEAGRKVAATVVVANALPAGWSEGVLGYCGAMPMMMTASLSAPAAARRSLVACESVELECDTLSAPPPMASAPLPTPAPKSSGGVFNKLLRRFRSAGDTAEQVPAPTRGPNAVRIVVAAGQHAAGNGAIVFDSTNESLPDEVWFTSFMVRFADPQLTADAIDPGLVLLLYVGDPATPRARIRLADVLRLGGRRPLNLRREPGQIVRLVLDDPAGTWANGVPALEIVLDMK